MATFEEKFNKFSSIVLEDTDAQRDALLNEVEVKYNKIVEEKENEYLEEAYESIQKSIQNSSKSANEQLLQARMEAKKKLLSRREEIIGEVMEAVKYRLLDYKKTPGYAQWLKKKTQIAFFELGKGDKTVFISGADVKYKEILEAIADEGNITVEGLVGQDFIGGVKVYNKDKRISVDYSFKEMLQDAKRKFLQTSGLSVR